MRAAAGCVACATLADTNLRGPPWWVARRGDADGLRLGDADRSTRTGPRTRGGHDVEWAMSGSRILVLQDRPITAALPALPAQAAASSWRSPIPGARCARMSICDSWLPEPLSPLFATTLFPRLIETWAANWEGRRVNSLVPRPMHGTIEGYAYLRIDFPLNRHPWLTARLIGSWLAFHLSPVERRWRRAILPTQVRRVRELSTVDIGSEAPAQILAVVDELETLSARYWAIIGGWRGTGTSGNGR